MRFFINLYRKLFSRPFFYQYHRMLLRLACKGLGMSSSDPDTNGEFWFLAKYGRDFRVVLDIGAHTGKYAEALLKYCPNAVVLCFEPHPRSNSVLRQKFGNVPRIHIIQKAVGGSSGQLRLFDHLEEQGTEHASLVPGVIENVHRSPSESTIVDVTSLDDFVKVEALTAIDFMKIDVEGGESAVLAGAKATIAHYKPLAIQVEFNDMNLLSKYSLIDLASQLSAYTLYRLLPRSLVEIGDLWNIENKIFIYQNILAMRK
jgi:FkbM family methyltransferase